MPSSDRSDPCAFTASIAEKGSTMGERKDVPGTQQHAHVLLGEVTFS